MATANKTIIEKANLEISDLIANGGYMQPEKSASFIQNVVEESQLLKLIDVRSLASHTQIVDKIGVSGRVLRPGVTGQAVREADRVKPVTDQVTLNTVLMKGEIRLPDETLEDNIEAGSFKDTVMEMLSENVAKDMEDLLINGDTNSADTLLALLDGMLKSASSHIVAGGSLPINKALLKSVIKALPAKYDSFKGKMAMFTSRNAVLDYRDALSDRATSLGDASVTSDDKLVYGGRPIIPVPLFPDNQGGGTETSLLYCDPKNARWGIWRKLKIETDRDITTGEYVVVISLRAGFKWKEADAVVKATAIKSS